MPATGTPSRPGPPHLVSLSTATRRSWFWISRHFGPDPAPPGIWLTWGRESSGSSGRVPGWTLPDNSDEGALIGYLFDYKMNRNKESVVIDLRTEDGKQVFRSLAARADVVVENYRAGVMDRLGLGYESLSADHPELVYVSLSGFGATGPWSPWRSYGPTIEAASSIEARTGYVDGEPLRLGHTLPDGVGGLVGTLAALDGLRRRDLTGKGGRYDLSQLEAYCALSGEELLASSVQGDDQPRRGNSSRRVSPHGVYPCRGDDQWIALGGCKRRRVGANSSQW